MIKVAFIVQRYGLEVNGGAENHCRQLAENMIPYFDVTVLTTCALDYEDWDNCYKAGNDILNGVKIVRFKTLTNRLREEFAARTDDLYNRRYVIKNKWQTILDKLFQQNKQESLEDIKRDWFRTQGPYCPDLIAYLKKHHSGFHKLIFFTYLYYPTAEGIKIKPRKSILIPTAHDEPAIYLPIFRDVFTKPRYILYNSISEKLFVERQFGNSYISNDIVGVGVESPGRFLEKTAIKEVDFNVPYFLYIGRLDENKINQLPSLFLSYKEKFSSNVRLVIIGKGSLKIETHPDIILMGFVSDEVKNTLLINARALIMPSKFESLSLVTLESMSLGVPVVVNELCEVLKNHIELSQGGLLFKNQEEFNTALEYLRNNPLDLMQKKARDYVKQNYSWSQVLKKITTAIEY